MFKIEVDNHDIYFGYHKSFGYYTYTPQIGDKKNKKIIVFIVDKNKLITVIKKIFFANLIPDNEIDYESTLTILRPCFYQKKVLNKTAITTHCYKCKTTLVRNDDCRCDKCGGIICPKCNSCMCGYWGSNA